MYLLYVDESGDIGLVSSPSRYFILSGFVVHELAWHNTLEAIIDFRRRLRQRYGLKLREEIHAAHFVNRPSPDISRFRRDIRLRMLREVLDFEATLADVNVLNVLVDKQNKGPDYDVFNRAWTFLFQRFENTISHRNLPGPQNPQDQGVAIVDRTDEVKLRGLLRRLRRYNPVPNISGVGYRQLPMRTMIEDPVHRDSLHSYFIQLADVNAYFLKQREEPCDYVRRKGARNYFLRLDTILCKVASRHDAYGVVRL